MLIVPGDPDCQSAGSFFKNPVLTGQQHEALQKRAQSKGSVAQLSRARKSQKSFGRVARQKIRLRPRICLGHVGISSKHALAIVNHGGATASEVLALKDQSNSASKNSGTSNWNQNQ